MRIVSFLLVFLTFSAFAQRDIVPLRFQKITSEQGLPHNYVHSVTQDKKGFIWIGTNYGLARYDGYNFKVFQPDPQKPHSITHKPIEIVNTDTRGNLWLTVNGGVNRMDLQTEQFTGYFYSADSLSLGNYFRTLTEDKDSVIWISSNNGLFYYNHQKDRFENALSKIKFSITNREIFYTADDRCGNMWFVVQGKAALFDKKTGEIIQLGDFLGDTTFNHIPFHSVFTYEKGKIWLASHTYGLLSIDINSHKTERYLENETFISEFYQDKTGNIYAIVYNNAYKILACRKENIGKKAFESYSLYRSNNFFQKVTVLEDRNGNLWLSSLAGLSKFNFNTGITYFEANNLYPNQISDNSIESAFIDKSDNLWLCPYRKGINKADLNQKPFKSFQKPYKTLDDILMDKNVSSVYIDSKNLLWFGEYYNGVSVYNPGNNKYYRYGFYTNNHPVTAVYEDNDGHYWIGTYWAALFRVKPRDINHLSESHDNTFLTTETYYQLTGVRKIVPDRNNNLWFATTTGLVEYQRSSGQFINHSSRYDKLNNSSSFYRTIYIDQDQVVWTGSNSGGLCKYDQPTREFTHYLNNPSDPASISNNTVYAIYRDAKGYFWIGTGQGLERFDPVKEEFKHIGKADDLDKRSIFSIVPDDRGNLWMSGDGMNIIRYNIASDKCFFYGPADGFESNDFNTTASFHSKTGEIYYGGSGGIVAFTPAEIRPDTLLTKPVITNLRIQNILVSPGDSLHGRVLLRKQVWETNKIKLRYNESEFTIEFSALHFSSPEKIRYQYKLEGFNSEWINTDSKRRYATYTGLPPGEYVFILKATNSDGLMCKSEDEARLFITIVPPIWKTLGFKIIVILVLTGGGVWYIWRRIRKLRTKNVILNEKVKDRTRELEEANHELDQHRNKLEFLVEERTRELETALLKAEESSRLKTSFLMNMSHEIRTPMNAIIGFSTLLKDKDLSTYYDEYVNTIITNGYTLLTLINDILELSSLQTQQVSLIPDSHNLQALLKQVYETHHIEVTSKKLELKLNSDLIDQNFRLVCDRVRLTQVFSNLISNARKFTNSGFIEFGINSVHDKIIFYVKDTGIGIPPDTGNAIFERFYKIEKDKTQLYRGTGLGLAICKNIVSLWDGEIWYESEQGKGSVFYFSHPVSFDSRSNPEVIPGIEIQTLKLKGKTILIAEDEESNFKLLETYFRNTHAQIIWVKNGHDAIQATMDHAVDLILMDIKMPQMDGIEASIKIREMNPEIPIIAQTAYAFKHEVEEFLKSGIDDYLVKPIHKSKLFAMIKKYLKGNS